MFAASLPIRAYTLQYTDATAKVKVKWGTNKIDIYLSSSLNQPQTNIKPGSNVEKAVRKSLEHWSSVANIEFDIKTSPDQSVSSLESGGDGKSLITVAPTAENFALFTGDANETAARTRLFYTKSGRITEADIVLNPYQHFSTDGSNSTYDIEATVTHEIGHLLGLEHSCVMGATMQPRQGKNGLYDLLAFAPRTLSEDDKAGIRSLYGVPLSDEKLRGSIIGKIVDEKGLPVFGANVWAEDAETGRVIASALTFSNGTYRLSSMDEGKYRLIVESLDGPISPYEIISKRGAYSALFSSPPSSFRTQEIGQVAIEDGKVSTLNGKIENVEPNINLTRIGFNWQISTVSVAVNAGRTYTIFIAGENVNAKNISVENISFSSPLITVTSDRLIEHQTVSNTSVISFEIEVASNIAFGEYSLRLQTKDGETAYLVGAITIDNVANDWYSADKNPLRYLSSTVTED
jgi:hypothetical protein